MSIEITSSGGTLRYRSLFVLFFVSGFTALVFEVVWARQALLIFGNTTLANAAVIAAYMTGLALGSHLFGKLADTKVRNPVRLYALLEAGIGVFAIFFPLLVKVLDPIYRAIYSSFHEDFITLSLIRFALSFLVLIVPTTLMGGTLPLLSRFLSREPGSLKENISKLYAMNLFGAMTGSFLAGFVLIAWIGLQKTSILAALCNLLIFAYVVYRMRPQETNVPDVDQPQLREASSEGSILTRRNIAIIMALLAIHGFVAFVIQICWTRTIALVLGSSTYSFSAMLTTFLAGLGLGTWAVARFAHKNIKLSIASIGYMEIAVGASVILFIPVFEWMIYFFVRLFPFVQQSVFATFSVQFLICALSMIVPTFLMGLVFPAILLFLGKPQGIGQIVGRAYAINTLGGVLGCILAGFFFISRFGVNGSLKLVGVLSIFAGLAAILMTVERSRWKVEAGRSFLAMALPALFLLYPWDKHLFSSGAFIYAEDWAERAALGKSKFQKSFRGTEIIYYKDGISSTVTVLQYDTEGKVKKFKSKSLRVNGKTDASTIGDMGTQLYLGYIPLFAHPDPKEVLVVGLGAGVTLGTVTQFPGVQSIECVEIEPAVVEANRFFSAENNYALKDPRVKVIIGDGRNHIRYSPKKYDVIISEPSNPWISGISNLFTVENYREALGKLDEDGIYCQWFHAYQMSIQDFQMIIKTFAEVFPEISLYRVGGNDYFLLGSRGPITYRHGSMMRFIEKNAYVKSDLKFFSEHEEHFVIGSFQISNRDLREAIAREAVPLNTDDHLVLEYNAPKQLYRRTGLPIFEWLHSFARRDIFPAFEDWDDQAILGSPNIWEVLFKKGVDALRAGNPKSALELLRRAAKLKPGEDSIIFEIGKAHEALDQFKQAMKYYGLLSKKPQWKAKAESAANRAMLESRLQENPIMGRSAEFLNVIASLSFFAGDPDRAAREIERAIDIDPNYVQNYTNQGMFHYFLGNLPEGARMLKKAEALDPDHPEVLKLKEVQKTLEGGQRLERQFKIGQLHLLSGDYKKAGKVFREVVERDPKNHLALALLAQCEEKMGRPAEAQKYRMQTIEVLKAAEEEGRSKKASA